MKTIMFDFFSVVTGKVLVEADAETGHPKYVINEKGEKVSAASFGTLVFQAPGLRGMYMKTFKSAKNPESRPKSQIWPER